MSFKLRQAVILAGGKGTRLMPYTTSFPKPLVPLGERPILEVILGQLKKAGFREAVLSTGHLAELIEAYFGAGRKVGLKLRYVREEKPLSTAGALAMIRGLDSDFLVMNGDILSTADYQALGRAHRAARAAATIGIVSRDIRMDYGVVHMTPKLLLARFEEKPVIQRFVSMGVNVLSRRALAFIKKGEALGMPDLLLRLKDAGEPVLCHPHVGPWFDIGRPEDYQLAQDYFQRHPRTFGAHG